MLQPRPAVFRVVARELTSRKSRLPIRGCCCCDRDRDSDRPGTSPRPRAPGPRRRRLRFPPARTMKWMFKEDHALGKGGPGPGCPPRCPGASPSRSPVSGRTAACGPAEVWRRARDGLAGRPETPGGLRGGRGPCGHCPLCLGRWRYCYCAATNYEFCSQSTDVSSRQKSEPNTLIVSR